VNPVIINRLDRVRTGHGSYYLRKVMGFKCGSWKSNMLSENKKGKKTKSKETTDESETGFNFSTNRHKYAFCSL